MPITAPAYNPELNTDQTGNIKSRIVIFERYIQKPQHRLDESSLPFVSLVCSEQYELAIEINRKKLEGHLNKFEFVGSSLDKLCENEMFFDDLFYIQNTVPSYFDNYKLTLDYFIDPEEDSESFTVIVETDMEVNQALDLEDRYFEEVFDKIYSNSSGRITFKVQPSEF